MTTKVDLIGNGRMQGDVANQLYGDNLNINAMKPYIAEDGKAYVTVFNGGDAKDPKNYKAQPIQTNATLRRDEWKQLDERVQMISDSRLVGIQDLISAGLTYNLGNAMGTTVLEWHDVSDAMEADLTMDGVTRSAGDRPSFGTNYMPIPIIHSDFEINARVLEASRRLGNPLDATAGERAARKVSEKLEEMLFTNTTYTFGGGTIYSYINHTSRNQVTLATAWDDSSKTAAQILADVISMKQSSINAKHYGPWMLYVPTAYETVLDEDYDTQRGNTVRQRIEAVAGINGVKVVDTLPADNVVLVQMTQDVVRLVRGMGIQTVQWKTEGMFVNKYKVMTIQVPQVRADQDGNSGIVHLA